MAVVVISGNPELVSGPTATLKLGAAVSAWDILYRDSTDNNQGKPAVTSAAASSDVYGMAMSDGTDNGSVVVALPGAVVQSSAADFVAGTPYFVDDGTAGAVTLTDADIASSSYKTLALWAETTTKVHVVGLTKALKA